MFSGQGIRGGLVADTTIRIGLHKVGAYHEKSVIGLSGSGLAWCAPILMCGPVGPLVTPTGAILGNELGVDVTAHLLSGVSGDTSPFGAALGVRPTFRVARDSRFRTASWLGSLMPEVGLAFPSGRSREVYFEFNPYPIAATLTREVAIQLDVLRERIGVPLNGDHATITIGTSLSVMLL